MLVAVALGLRLYDLGDRPFHHDESQDAYFSWVLWTKGDYKYMPILHGPLRFYLTAGMFSLFGDSDFTARLAPALMGTSMVAMPYFLRNQLGRVAAFTAAVLLAIGPSYLYFSRFAREDIYFAAISFALLVVVFRFLDRPALLAPGGDRGADRARLRDQGDDVHHRLRRVHVLRAAVLARAQRGRRHVAAGQVGRLGVVGVGAGRVRDRRSR